MRCKKECAILLSIYPSFSVRVTQISSVALKLTVLSRVSSLHCTASHIHSRSLFILNYCCSLVALDLFGMNCAHTMYTKNPVCLCTHTIHTQFEKAAQYICLWIIPSSLVFSSHVDADFSFRYRDINGTAKWIERKEWMNDWMKEIVAGIEREIDHIQSRSDCWWFCLNRMAVILELFTHSHMHIRTPYDEKKRKKRWVNDPHTSFTYDANKSISQQRKAG